MLNTLIQNIQDILFHLLGSALAGTVNIKHFFNRNFNNNPHQVLLHCRICHVFSLDHKTQLLLPFYVTNNAREGVK